MTLNKILLLIAFSGLYIGFIMLIFSLCKSTKLRDQMFNIIKFKDYHKEVGD